MKKEPVVYITRNIPKPGIEILEESCEVVVRDGKKWPSKGHIIKQLSELQADGLLCESNDDIDAEVLDASPKLKVVSIFSTGYDHIDINAANERNIAVGHTPSVLTGSKADFAWSLLMTCARRTVEGHQYVSGSEWDSWQPELLTGPEINGATLGIIGLGDIGTAVAQRTVGFDMEVLYSDVERRGTAEYKLDEMGVNITYVDQEEVFSQSDFVSLHVPLHESTQGLVGEEQFERMKESAVLINTCPSPIVETEALMKALDEDQIERVGLDVKDAGSLSIDHRLLEYAPEKLVMTPHLASASIKTRRNMAMIAAENTLAGVCDDPLPNSAIEDAS